jgi:hypothetical protein
MKCVITTKKYIKTIHIYNGQSKKMDTQTLSSSAENRIFLMLFCLFWVALGFELRASSLLGRRSTSGATLPVFTNDSETSLHPP